MAFRYSSQLFMTVDGVPVELKEMSYDVSFGAKQAVQAMNPKNRPLGTIESQGEATFNVKVPHRAGLPNWPSLRGATIKFLQSEDGNPSFTAIDAFYMKHNSSASVEGQQEVDIEFGCLDWLEAVEPA